MTSRSGVLLVDKPAGITSADLTNQLKKKFRFDRIGHGGTLDPFATGLMVVLLGEATKVARFLLDGDKEYLAVARLGVETDTGDLTGEEIARCEPKAIPLEDWQRFALKWTGTISQTPPAYSAVKVKGRPLYDYARKGEEVEVKARDVIIRQLEIESASETELQFRVRSSGGTYIRVLAADLARTAGSCAHLSSLRRTGSSAFRVENASTLEALLALSPEELPLRPIEEALAHLPLVSCNEVIAQKIRQGNLAAFDVLREQIRQPGYFLLVEAKTNSKAAIVAVCNHHPMMRPSCTIERVFDPSRAQT